MTFSVMDYVGPVTTAEFDGGRARELMAEFGIEPVGVREWRERMRG